MKTATISSMSKEFVLVPVAAKEEGLPIDPTSSPVEMAFAPADTDPEEWNAATWETAGSKYYARCLVGPGVVELEKGLLQVWVRVTDNPEVPVLRAGELRVI